MSNITGRGLAPKNRRAPPSVENDALVGVSCWAAGRANTTPNGSGAQRAVLHWAEARELDGAARWAALSLARHYAGGLNR